MAVSIINLVLCIIILALGIWGYVKKKNHFVLFMGIAFGLFGVVHLMDILGVPAYLLALIIVIRLAAYVLIIFSMSKYLIKNKKA